MLMNDGNYGVVYKIHADKPRKMAVMIMARGGVFKGPFKINGEIIPVPYSGVLRRLMAWKYLRVRQVRKMRLILSSRLQRAQRSRLI